MTPPPRKWLMDRITGDSKYGDRDRPTGPCCWVPPTVGWCPALLEENICCKLVGKMGAYTTEAARFYLMHLGFMLNFISILMIAYSCLGMSDDFDILSNASFSKLTLSGDVGEMTAGTVMRVGLRSVSLSKDDVEISVINFDQFCEVDGFDAFLNQNDCDSCQSMAANYTISIMFAAILILPILFINISRMYSGYDVNCSKCFSGILSLASILLAFNTMFTYTFFCRSKFYSGIVPFSVDGDIFPEKESYFVNYDWQWGWGFIFLIAGVVLKTFELMINCCIPTPSITRDRKEQDTYEVIQDWKE